MKKLIYNLLIPISISILSITSCSDYLNYDYLFKDEFSLDSVFLKRDYTEQWLASVYAVLSDGQNIPVASKGNQPFNFLADDMYYSDNLDEASYEWYKNCRYKEDDLPGTWTSCYRGIRNASVFIHNVDKNIEMTPDEILDNKGQARFLRAYFYWVLIRKYGPVPILPDEGMDYTLDYDELAIARNTYEECAEFVAQEMGVAAQELTDKPRSNREIARATRGAALAVRARAYLYAASPLFNGNKDDWAQQLVDDAGNPLLTMEYKEELWAKAAAAAKEVIDMGIYRLYTAPFRETDMGEGAPKTIKPPYHKDYSDYDFPAGWRNIDPFESYRSVFNGTLQAYNNPELIFSRVNNVPRDESILGMVLYQMPRSLNGLNCHGVTMKHTSTYYMANGEDFYAYGLEDPRVGRPDFGYTTSDNECLPLRKGVSKEYADREPRFYASIAYNGSYWETLTAPTGTIRDGARQVFYYRGTQDGLVSGMSDRYLTTGIGIKKFVHPDDYFERTSSSVGSTKGPVKVDVDIRYAEILLIYAEALNELTGSYTIPNHLGDGTISVSRDVSEMSKAMKQIRVRAGLTDFAADIYGNADSFRKALKRERQIELFAECHRYFDLRRWKDAAKEEAQPVWGHNMSMTEDQKDLFHIPTPIPSLPTIFIDKMYLWPIYRSELKRNPKLTQNPGWQYYD